MIQFQFVKTHDDLEKALYIRRNVFINEMGVPESIELDEFDTLDSQCMHILALYENKPIGTLRANLTIKDKVKFQRFLMRMFCKYHL